MSIDQAPKITKLRIIKNLIMISLSFFLLFTAYDGLSMLQSTMNKKGGIGVISQGVAFISFSISALLLPKYVIRKLGCKMSLIVSIGLYLPAIAANFYPTWLIMISSAVLGGIGASILWGSQCTYFNESAFRYARLITDGIAKRDQSPEIPSIYTSIETLSVRNSIYEIIDENPSKDSPSIKDNLEVTSSEDSVVRYRCKNPSYGNENEIEVNSEQHGKNAVENGNTPHTKEESKFNHLENSPTNDISPLSVQIHEGREEIEKKYMQESAKMSNVENISGIISKGISKLHDESVSPKRNPDSQPVFQRANTLESVTGLFFGVHGIAYYSAQICSNGISYYVLQGDDDDDALISYSDGCSCGAQFCNDNPGCINEDTEYVSENIRYLLTGISTIIGVISVLLVVFFVDPLQKAKSEDEPEKISLRLVSATINHNKKKEQLCLIPMSFFEGMQQGFYTADYTKSYVGCAWGASNVGLVSVFFGSACVISSLLSGFLVKYAGRMTLFCIGQVISILMMVFLMLWEPDSDTPYYFYIGAIFFGTTTGIYWSQLLAFYGLLFKKDEEAAFSSYYLWSSLGWTVSFLYSDHLCTYVKIYLLFAVSVIGTTGYLYTERAYELRKKQGNILST